MRKYGAKNGGDSRTNVYMQEGTTLRATVADRPYGEFYDFYSVSPENFGSTHVYTFFLNELFPTMAIQQRKCG